MVTLTAGVTCLGAGPAAAADCREAQARLGSPAAALCDELTKVRLSNASGPMLGSQSTHLALGAVRLAERLGLTGLATARSAMGMSDLGGIVANSAMPSPLPGVARATNLAKLPALPMVPQVKKLPPRPGARPPVTKGTRLADVPLDLTRPTNQIKEHVVRHTLPQVSHALGEARLPANSLDGVTGLLRSLNLD